MKSVTKLFFTAMGCLALLSRAHAVSPPPDGGYINKNTAEGDFSLARLNVDQGIENTALGFEALDLCVSGSYNTAAGAFALLSNQTGDGNTAMGVEALTKNTTGQNTAFGYRALFSNTNGGGNTATGYQALLSNQTGVHNTAVGFAALVSNTASDNTASGFDALATNKSGSGNTAIGSGALQNSTSSGNTATGFQALFSNKANGNLNTAYGASALQNNTTGSRNIALGFQAGANLTTGGKNIDIGNVGSAGEGNTIRIGTEVSSPFMSSATFIAHIYGQTVDAASGVPVFIDNTGHLGTVQSSERFKQAIRPMDKSSEALLALEPVTFQYKPELDPKGVPQFGLVAEQVEKVAPQLVVHDKQGKPYTVRYEAVNAMLLNEFLKEHRKATTEQCKVEEQARAIHELTGLVRNQQKQIESLTAGLQKVSEEVELAKPVSKAVASN